MLIIHGNSSPTVINIDQRAVLINTTDRPMQFVHSRMLVGRSIVLIETPSGSEGKEPSTCIPLTMMYKTLKSSLKFTSRGECLNQLKESAVLANQDLAGTCTEYGNLPTDSVDRSYKCVHYRFVTWENLANWCNLCQSYTKRLSV